MLSKVVTRDKVDIVQHMIDPSYKLPEGLTPKGMVKNYLDANFPRGLKAFHDHFDEFANLLILDSFYRREQRREKNLGKKNSKRTNLDTIRTKNTDCLQNNVQTNNKHPIVLRSAKVKNLITALPARVTQAENLFSLFCELIT